MKSETAMTTTKLDRLGDEIRRAELDLADAKDALAAHHAHDRR